MEGHVQVGLSNQVCHQQVPIVDGIGRGCVEGFLTMISIWNRCSRKLNWPEEDWHGNWLLATLGNVNGAIDRVIDSEFFSYC